MRPVQLNRIAGHGIVDGLRRVKRLTDLALALLLILVSSPLLAACALAVRISMGRPVLFCQERLGLHGRGFVLYKFRTMNEYRDPNGQLRADDERLTSVGSFLRRTSLDELPQLINVVLGDMSLVGPRPLLPEYWNLYTDHQRRRNDVLPGITGAVQISGRNSLSWQEKFELDVAYVNEWSLFKDFKILALTSISVFGRKGISSEGFTTMPRFEGDGSQEFDLPA